MANDLETKIIRQVEYYFGDINLPRDKFMQEKLKDDDGWIALDVLLSFKRLADLTKDPQIIVDALRKSENQLVIVSEDSKKVKRSPDVPLPELNEERRKELMMRTAYVKGFPLDEALNDIVTFFEPYGPIDSIMRRTYVDKLKNERKFKGSCFVIFKTIESCKKFIEAESLEYKGTQLIRKWQKDYIEEKRKEVEERKKNKLEKQAKKKAKKEADETEENDKIPKGTILHFAIIDEQVENGKDEMTLTREEIKEKVKEICTHDSYLDFNKGDREGFVRLMKVEENAAKTFHEKLEDGTVKIVVADGKEINLRMRIVDGAEEEEYLKKVRTVMAQKRDRKGRKGGGRKYQQHQRKRQFQQNDTDDEPKLKKQAD